MRPPVRYRLRWFVCVLALIAALASLHLPSPHPAAAAGVTRVGLSGERFTINGAPTFLLGVSYFDLRFWRESDLDRLDQLGYNLMRVWLDWRERGVFSGDGTLSESGRARLLGFVEAADRRGIVVDVTILDTDLTFDQGDATTAVRAVGTALAGHSNVIYDLVNEHNHAGVRFSYDQVGQLAAALRATDSDAILGVSGVGGYLVSAQGAVNAGAVARELGAPIRAQMLLPHMARTADWVAQTGPRVRALRSYLADHGQTAPVYLQEEARRGHSGLNPSRDEFLGAARAARAAGAAAWVFHTDAGFALDERSFFDGLDEVERRVVDALPGAVLGVPPTPAPTAPPQPQPTAAPQPSPTAQPPGQPGFAVGSRIEAEDAQTATERDQNGNAGTAPGYPNRTGLNVNACYTCSNRHAAGLHWGERAGYYLRVPDPGRYTVRLRAHADTPERTLTLLLDGVVLVEGIGVRPTERLNDMVTVSSGVLSLPAGTHHLEIQAPRGMAVDWLQVDPAN